MKWTAYSEEKPQKVGSYLVTHITNSGHYYVDYDYWTVYDKFKYHPTDVVAWMPFPEPYTADRKTEPQNYCDDCLYTDTCDSKAFFYACTSKATISKMEQVEDEPQTERSE